MSNKEKIFAISFIALGAASIGSQILILRELLKVFYGNELSIAIILGSWLFLISLGSLVLGKLADRIRNDIIYFSSLLIVLSLTIPLCILLCRLIKPVLGLNPGEIPALVIILYSSLVILCAFCILYGFLFVLGCKIYARLRRNKAKGVGGAFFLEALGSIAGGSIISLVLLSRVSPFHIAFLVSLLVLLLAFLLSRTFGPKKAGPITYLTIALIALNVTTWSTGTIDKISAFSERLAWSPFRFLRSENSIYGNLAATSQESQITFYSNGLFLFSFPDKLTSEETIHYALLSHPEPKSVLLVGGGTSGALNELYKYNITAIDYVELDPLLIKMAQEVIGEDLKAQLKNPILRIIEGDGRLYIKTTENRYDIIIISAPDPYTMQINRLYTIEFFREVKKRLRKGGILSISCTASEHYIGPEMAEYLRSIYKTLKEANYGVGIIPGETVRFLASDIKDGTPRIDAKFFREMLYKKGIETYFVKDYYLSSKLSRERLAYAEGMISDVKYSHLNADFKPISYYYDIILWTTYFQSKLKTVLGSLSERRIWYSIAIVYLLISIFYFRRRKVRDMTVFIAIGTTGFSEMAIEVNLMLAFQVIYGYLYYKLGLLITIFMAGLFIGAYYTTKKLENIKLPLMLLKKCKILLGAVPFICIPILKILSTQTAAWPLHIGSILIFPLLMLLVGVIGGMQFPVANKIIFEKRGEVGKVSGTLYGIDVIGAMVGSLLIATVLIPIIGILQCLAVVGILNIVSAIILAPDNDTSIV